MQEIQRKKFQPRHKAILLHCPRLSQRVTQCGFDPLNLQSSISLISWFSSASHGRRSSTFWFSHGEKAGMWRGGGRIEQSLRARDLTHRKEGVKTPMQKHLSHIQKRRTWLKEHHMSILQRGAISYGRPFRSYIIMFCPLGTMITFLATSHGTVGRNNFIIKEYFTLESCSQMCYFLIGL